MHQSLDSPSKCQSVLEQDIELHTAHDVLYVYVKKYVALDKSAKWM